VTTELNTKVCGRETTCDLVLDHSTVSRYHAQIELADDDRVFVCDNDSRNGTFLNRNDSWIRIKKVTLCIGDRIRFGDIEVSLKDITTVFGRRSNARLEARHFALGAGAKPFAKQVDHGPVLQKPRRNPATGKIEEIQTGQADSTQTRT
jgi:pSer/pThr/pTyr-binding forkhead associated (FHA) protein